MEGFGYRDGALYCEQIPVTEIARELRTPVYVYSKAMLLDRYDALAHAFAPLSPLVCYSVKANSNLALLRLFRERGSGFDVVSGGELFRCMKVEADPQRIVFAGVGKTEEEIRYALRKQIFCFNVESIPEMERLHEIAREMGGIARVALRVNPDVDPRTHRYVATGKRESKFGLDIERAASALERLPALGSLELVGLHMHIGSQILEVEPYTTALERLLAFADAERAKGRRIELINVGGGFGIPYQERRAPTAEEIAGALVPPIKARGYRLLLEPGRFITGSAGILVTKVLYVKESGERRFLVCDAGMNDLVRPALYGSYHRIWPVAAQAGEGEAGAPEYAGQAEIVGPICEVGDFLGHRRPFPAVRPGDLLAVFTAGAYGMSMSSNYNSRPRPAEVLVDGPKMRVIRRRETYDDLVAAELVE